MEKPITSIIVPVKNERMITQMCLDSMMAYTKDFELILVDDGSGLDTANFLANFKRKWGESKRIDLIKHSVSLGWPKSINDGFKKAKGQFVCCLNNDCVVSPNWLEKMIHHFTIDKTLGVIGPTTNKVEGYQHIDYNKNGVTFQYSDSLTGFCLLFRKDIFDKIGGLDERFGLGGQDDASACIEVRKIGYKVGIARDVYLYHYGSASFRTLFKNDAAKSIIYAQSKIKQLRDKYRDDGTAAITKRIFIAIPNDGFICSDLINVLLHWSHDSRFQIRIYMPKNIFPLDAARSHCVREFLELDFDYILWIDNDISCPIETLERLVCTDKDAIGAVAMAMKYENGEAYPYPVTLRYNEDKQYVAYYGQGIEQVDAVGGACVLVKRKVYETIERPYQFHYHRNGGLSLTCDFDLWQKFYAKGFKLFVDFDLICSHFKEVDIKMINNLLVRLGREGANKKEIAIQ